MKNKIQLLREKNRHTQKELAEKAGLSLRTIQRIEAGNIPKGFTLKALAESLNTTPENLIEKEDIIKYNDLIFENSNEFIFSKNKKAPISRSFFNVILFRYFIFYDQSETFSVNV